MPENLRGLRQLAIQAATLYELTEAGRLCCCNSPDRSPAPRMWMAGSADGNVVRFGVDITEKTARAIEALVAREPPMSGAHSAPFHVEKYVEILGSEAPVNEVSRGITYTLPNSLQYEHSTRVVSSQTPEGAQLLACLEADGMPEDLVDMGFVDPSDFWPPWCVALQEGTIVSIAFAARVSSVGAEEGVVTPPAFRGRGFAAAATAAWASLPVLVDHALFYSTNAANVSSQRVAHRLRLPFLGSSLSIS